MKRFCQAAIVAVATTLFAANAIASITLTAQFSEIRAIDAGSSASDLNLFFGTTVPSINNIDAIAANSHSKNLLDWSISGGITTFSFDQDHKRDGTFGSIAWSHQEGFIFTSDCTQPYTMSGFYSVTDAGTGGGGVYMGAIFGDSTTSTLLLDNYQYSVNTNNEQFTLGGVGGDIANGMAGSLTGTLIAGHTYEWRFLIFDEAPLIGDAGASALGNITLIVGPCEDDFGVVPEPLSAVVWCGMIFAVGIVARTRRLLAASRAIDVRAA